MCKSLEQPQPCCLRLTESLKGSGRTVIADSWFGSVKSAVELMNQNGLYAIMLVKTAHRNYPKSLLNNNQLSRGKWVSMQTESNGVKLQANKFMDLKNKQFITTCSTDLPGPPRKTKHAGDINRPMVAYEYLESAASIDIHNHVRTGSLGFEDIWKTKQPIHRQFAGVVGFIFTNAYLASNYFQKKEVKHVCFKINLSNAMVTFEDNIYTSRNSSLTMLPEQSQVTENHIICKFSAKGERKQKPCFYCRHGKNDPKRVLTSYYCQSCGEDKPLCAPTSGRQCFHLHILHGMPKKRYFKKKQ